MPRVLRALLRLTLPADWRDDIARDLEEAWARRRRERGRVVASMWLTRQAIAFSLRFVPERLAELSAAPTSADLKLALRSVRRSPLVALLAILSLGVGIGAAVGGYTFTAGALFTGLPFPGGERIVLVQDYDERNRHAVDVGAEEFLRRRARLSSFESLEAFVRRSVVVGDDPTAQAVAGALFGTPGLLAMTGVTPALGRLPDESEARPGADPVVVLPHSMWVTLTGADPGAVGSRLEIGGTRRTVIGVMPEGFGFPWGEALWIPVDVRELHEPVRVLGKYRSDLDVTVARAEVAAVARPDPAQIEDDASIAHLVTSVTRPMTDPRQIYLVGIPVAVLVLLLVVMATNVANLVLSRNALRASELAVRGALGASRARIVGQLVAEVAVVVALATALGLGMSDAVIRAVETRIDLPFWTDFSLRPGAVLFAVALAALVTGVAGLAPALRATGRGGAAALRDGGRGASAVRFGRLTGLLIVVQVTICVGFLSVATVLGQSLLTFGFERYGLPGDETLVAQIYFGWPQELSDPDLELTPDERERIRSSFMREATRRREQIRESALEIPGVRMAAYGSRFPGNATERAYVEIEGQDQPLATAEVAEIGEGYLELLGAPVLQGRAFTPEQHLDGLPVALVNEPFVRDRLAGANPLGRRVRVVPLTGSAPERYTWATIVGVVPDIGLNPGNPANAAAVFTPLPDINIVRLALRGDSAPRGTSALIRIAQEAGPEVRVQWTNTLSGQMREPVMIIRGLGVGFLVMGLLALVLSAASIHALTACAVTRRTREIGIRQALGAGATRIGREMLRRSAFQLGLGGALGLAVAWGFLRVAQAFPWEIRQGNPAALAIVVGVLVLSGGAALAQPLRRALTILPADAMRAE